MKQPDDISSPERLLDATDNKIEEVAMWVFSGYCIRLSNNKMVTLKAREAWKKLANRVQAICDMRYGSTGEGLLNEKGAATTVINDKAKPAASE